MNIHEKVRFFFGTSELYIYIYMKRDLRVIDGGNGGLIYVSLSPQRGLISNIFATLGNNS